jgi:hypothetical protein
MRRLKKSRRELFEEIERAALKPLPVRPYEYAEWAQSKVDLSYHVEHDGHFYRVHFSLIGGSSSILDRGQADEAGQSADGAVGRESGPNRTS